jgi:hypothetical protein
VVGNLIRTDLLTVLADLTAAVSGHDTITAAVLAATAPMTAEVHGVVGEFRPPGCGGIALVLASVFGAAVIKAPQAGALASDPKAGARVMEPDLVSQRTPCS